MLWRYKLKSLPWPVRLCIPCKSPYLFVYLILYPTFSVPQLYLFSLKSSNTPWAASPLHLKFTSSGKTFSGNTFSATPCPCLASSVKNLWYKPHIFPLWHLSHLFVQLFECLTQNCKLYESRGHVCFCLYCVPSAHPVLATEWALNIWIYAAIIWLIISTRI